MKTLHLLIIVILCTSLIIVNHEVFANNYGSGLEYFYGNSNTTELEHDNSKIILEQTTLKTKYKIGEKIIVTSNLINTGTQNIIIYHWTPAISTEVKDENSKIAWLYGGGFVLGGNPLRDEMLKPNIPNPVNTLPVTFSLDDPGNYTIISMAWIKFDSNDPGDFKGIALWSKPLPITILPEKYHPDTSNMSPLQQFLAGIPAKETKCKDRLELVLKPQNGLPVCIKIQTKIKLLERGWSEDPIGYTLDELPRMQQEQIKYFLDGIKLSLDVSPTRIQEGQSVTIGISLNNTFSKTLTVPANYNTSIPFIGLNSCISNPDGLVILKGHYIQENMTSRNTLSFSDMHQICPTVSFPQPVNYQFKPLSSHVMNADCKTFSKFPDLMCNIDTSGHISIKGYWEKNENFHIFDLGNYTVIGADEWGHTVIKYFEVTKPIGS